jgi:hypothetical protein
MSRGRAKNKKSTLQFTHRDLANIIKTGVYEITHVDLSAGDSLFIEGHSVDVDGGYNSMFSMLCNPTKFFALMAERGMADPLITSPVPATRRPAKKAKKKEEDKPVKASVDEAPPRKKTRRKRHPITNELVSAEAYKEVTDAIRVGGPKVEARLLKEFRGTGTVTL